MTAPGLYIPVHKRTASSESHHHHHNRSEGPIHTYTYSTDFLLSLRPTADESVKDKLRTSSPEIVMSRRIRKNLEFYDRQRLLPPLHQHIDLSIHRVPALPSQQPSLAPLASTSPQPHQPRVLSRRSSRTAIRPAERRRHGVHPAHATKTALVETWRPMEGAPRPSPQVV